MPIPRRLVVAGLLLGVVSCGGDKHDPPTAPSAPPGVLTLAIPGVPTSLAVGESLQLRAIVIRTDGSTTAPPAEVVWRSSNEAVVTMWPGGMLVALGPGDATITASAGELTGSAVLATRAVGDVRHVAGRVTDYVSGAGVAGLRLRFNRNIVGLQAETTTDSAGGYAVDLPVANYGVTADDQGLGSLFVRVSGPAFRGDFLVNGPGCVARYGSIIDAATFRPVAGATVSYGGVSAVTGLDGWYRIDHSCAGSVLGGTAAITVTHPDYLNVVQPTGRGLSLINRIDFDLRRP
jgi:Bacterial Ig-like domain (group 2)